ncbi:MAG TPA: DNA polymerase Y family protein [Candidatus Angelobacter sp.]|nr:DNA polymerase Y family protein [Candidatus Angelobacter sp.]
MFVAIHAPDFAAQAVLHSSAEAHGLSIHSKPVAILDGPLSLLRVFALNEAARQCGISPGMTRIQAEAFPQVELRQRSPELEASGQAAMVDCALRFSSQVEAASPGSIVLDAHGADRLFGPPKFLVATIAASASKLGFLVNIAIASNPDAAFYAALGFHGITIINPGQEAEWIASLFLSLLKIPAVVLTRLESMGIHTFHDLAALPSAPFVQRFGQDGLRLQNIARGRSHRELVPVTQSPQFIETHEFEDPIGDLEPLLFVLNRMLQSLFQKLQERSLGTNSLDLRLQLVLRLDRDLRHDRVLPNTKLFERSIRLPLPTQDHKTLLKLLHLDLSEHPPGELVKSAWLEAHPSALRFTQQGLFERNAPQPEQLEILLARLRGIVGENDRQGRDRVGMPVVLDTHSADAFAVKKFQPECNQHSPVATPRFALRIYRPPQPAKVKTVNGRPQAIGFDSHPSSTFRIIAASGPWRTSGGWTEDSERWERDEWDIAVENESIQMLRIYRDGGKRWFVDGMYD